MIQAGTKPGDESFVPLLGLFQGYGVEIEYMIVDRESLDVRPVADRLMEALAGESVSEWELNGLAWSNELALHVLEMKTNGPASRLRGLGAEFQAAVRRAQELLETLDCRLLPGGAHPWMDPDRETRLWPHEYNEVYRAFDRIFSCRGHGWSNVQSSHLNLPFRDDREFALLHAAVRVALPLLPALAASSPFLDGRFSGDLDARMVAYRENSRRVPSVAARVVPEPVIDMRQYEDRILRRIYADLGRLDPEGVLRHEWVNARGAIPRFQRGTIEIRILDTQECPAADLAVMAAVDQLVKRLVGIADGIPARLNALPTRNLVDILDDTIREGERARIGAPEFLALLDLPGIGSSRAAGPSAGEIWRALIDDVGTAEGDPLAEWRGSLEVITERGPLARRILEAAGTEPARDRLFRVYRGLAEALTRGRSFLPEEVKA